MPDEPSDGGEEEEDEHEASDKEEGRDDELVHDVGESWIWRDENVKLGAQE